LNIFKHLPKTPMNAPPRVVPRFVPTLTEVVDPAGMKLAPAQARSDLQDVIEQVQRDVLPAFEAQLEATFSQLLEEMLSQQHQTGALLRAELESLVAKTVTEVMAQRFPGRG
jgi:hypothetical protein